MRYSILVVGLVLAACTVPEGNSVVTAQPYIGLSERQDRNTLRDFVGVDPVRTEWCAAFVNAVLELDGIPGSDTVSDYPLTARSFLHWGHSINPQDIRRGDIVVFPRGTAGWQGHVGFFVQRHTDGRWVILGGNQSNEVRYDLYHPSRAIGIRRYNAHVSTEQNSIR